MLVRFKLIINAKNAKKIVLIVNISVNTKRFYAFCL